MSFAALDREAAERIARQRAIGRALLAHAALAAVAFLIALACLLAIR